MGRPLTGNQARGYLEEPKRLHRGAAKYSANQKFSTLAKRKPPAPLSLRFTFEESAKLNQANRSVPFCDYIKAKLFYGGVEKVCGRNSRRVEDHIGLARVLPALVQERLCTDPSGSPQVMLLVRMLRWVSLYRAPGTERLVRPAVNVATGIERHWSERDAGSVPVADRAGCVCQALEALAMDALLFSARRENAGAKRR